MGQTIEIEVLPDGTFGIEIGEKEETPEGEGEERQILKSAEEVMQAVSQMLQAGEMGPAATGEAPPEPMEPTEQVEEPDPAAEVAEEETAMTNAYAQRHTR